MLLTMLLLWAVPPASATCNLDVCLREYERVNTDNIVGLCALRFGCSATLRWMHTVPDEAAEKASRLLQGREDLAVCLLALNRLVWENDTYCNLLGPEPRYD